MVSLKIFKTFKDTFDIEQFEQRTSNILSMKMEFLQKKNIEKAIEDNSNCHTKYYAKNMKS